MNVTYPKIAQLKTVAAFRARLDELGIDLPVDDQILAADDGSPMSEPIRIGSFKVSNRWCIHPMEGWDAQPDGAPSELTLRRWENFGYSGAKLIWGGEAAAVQPDGRANPNQTLGMPENRAGLRTLLEHLLEAHREVFNTTDGLLVGLQLTHSGRFCRPHSKQLEPHVAYHHPLLDAKFGIDPGDQTVVCGDDYLEQLIDRFVAAAGVARDVGYQFVDIKSCHGYLLHEFLSARRRPGPFGGDFEGRTRMLTTIIGRVRDAYPDLMVGVRLSVFDMPPYTTSRGIGKPMDYESLLPYEFGFGVDEHDPMKLDLREPFQLIERLRELGVVAINLSAGSPYYNPHMQRPAVFPPSDGYLPPEDPLVGVARQIHAARLCKEAFPDLPMVGSGYTYLQDYLPHVAQGVVRHGWTDIVGLGRMVLAYPQLPADVEAGRDWQRKRVCRTFSDCTTAPRHNLVSGCFPLDPFYKQLPAAAELKELKEGAKAEGAKGQGGRRSTTNDD
jgi:2,4-dienoyl-CoA reductase-like NADH-dependent reductase (Old Yellow Enzyme family)